MKIRLLAVSALLCVPVFATESKPSDADHFKVTDEVLQKAPPHFSTNIGFGGFAPWNPDVRVNVWNTPFTSGPIQFQHHGRADAGGEDWLQQNTGARLSFWDCARSGFWDGADVYIYRIENGVLKFLRQTKIVKSVIGNDPGTQQPTEEKIWFADKGPAVMNGDFFVLRMQSNKMPLQVRPELLKPSDTPLLTYAPLSGKADWSFDPENPVPDGGSKVSLRLDVKEASPDTPAGPWHWYVAPNDKDSKLRFNPGKSYKAQVWLKQNGMADPRVRIQFGTVMTQIVDVTPEWKKFEFDLPVDSPEKPYNDHQNAETRMLIGALSPGTLWMGNFVVWQTDLPPYAVMPEDVEILKDFQPHVLRLWGGIESPSLDFWLSKGFAQPVRGGYGKVERSVLASLGETLEVCRQVGADPWLILNPWFTEQETRTSWTTSAGLLTKATGSFAPNTDTRNPGRRPSRKSIWNPPTRPGTRGWGIRIRPSRKSTPPSPTASSAS